MLELSPRDRSLADAKMLWGSFPFKCFLFTTRDLLNIALSFGEKWIGGRWKDLACCLSNLVRYWYCVNLGKRKTDLSDLQRAIAN